MKEDELGNLNLGDDLLLSSDSKKNLDRNDPEIAVEVFDFTDYIT
jgi:hypothetical protein